MAKLHHTIIGFFDARMAEHSRVSSYTRIHDPTEYMYKISRNGGLPELKVWLSDAYHFGIADYLGRPKALARSDFMLIARPEGGFDWDLLERARRDHVGIGKLSKFMGAINLRDPSTHITPEEREWEESRDKI